MVAYHTHAGSYNIRWSCETIGTGYPDGTLHNMWADYQWQRSINNLYYADGNVGIGTTSPAKTLHIQTNDSAYGSLRIQRNTTTQGETSIGFFGKSNTPLNEAWVIGENGWGHTGKFVIGNENGGAGGNVRMTIQRDGNVGIGTTSPGAKLHVDGTAIFDTQTGAQPFYITRDGAANQALKIYTDDVASYLTTIQDETTGNYGSMVFTLDNGAPCLLYTSPSPRD